MQIGDRVEITAGELEGVRGVICGKSRMVGIVKIELHDGRGGWISELNLRPAPAQAAAEPGAVEGR